MSISARTPTLAADRTAALCFGDDWSLVYLLSVFGRSNRT
jgi:hypothetical protein